MSLSASMGQRAFRITSTYREIWIDGLWLAGVCLLLVATGIGLRDPWPADEPRFALIARDMLHSGDWLVPLVGGDLYADKPPLYFWLIAAFLQLTGSLRVAFLLPSLLSALGCVLLVYDLARRLWGRQSGFIAALTLLFTVQFVWQARQAQIDATLCLWTTLSLYGLLRHLLLGPRWGWYAIGWMAAGFGVITKGVGFLPLLVLIPFALLRSPAWQPRLRIKRSLRWGLGPLAFLLAVSTWLIPMLLAARDGGALAAYRDEILFQQTIDRYAHAWHHREPFWYFVVNVIPVMWLPMTALLPWLIPKWRDALRRREFDIALLLAWVAMVVLFFSVSSGKRGVYVLPAVPALVLASARFLPALLQRQSVQRAFYALALGIALICAGGAIYLLFAADRRQDVIAHYAVDVLPALSISVVIVALCLLTRTRRGVVAYGGALTSALLVVSFWVNPAMNAARSGADFVQRVEQTADPTRELGWVAFKEQYLLNIRRPVVHFGHARWREAEQEAFDAAHWLAQNNGRQLAVDAAVRDRCFATAHAKALGSANRLSWYLVEGRADIACAMKGTPAAALRYVPPLASR